MADAFGQAEKSCADSLRFFEHGAKKTIISYFPIEDEQIDPIIFRGPCLFLRNFDEPVFCRNTTPRIEVFRFTWLRAFDLPFVITFSRDASVSKVEVKKGNKVHLDYSTVDLLKLTEEERDLYHHYEKEADTTKFLELFKKGLVKDTTRFKYSKKTLLKSDLEWLYLQDLIEENGFWKLESKLLDHGMTDGSIWILEAKTFGGYKFLIRQSPSRRNYPGFFEISKFLIRLADIRDERIY